ncbi:phosphopantetheine-binding protein [Saccharopolyspora oryzae]|uniref:Phosphopantetheine-binding protein n=1 Tax=Saccharopolyspora oryzae TaxID=2997343 RepID=A0ABT4UZD8_9PSEU|nr:phosphopantetheine-binding protein [Saccharopolyspora oryzae]MDA3627074.1 phosphopantetheine-binding protein [Saccharopolyspora oryzae]
MLTREEVFAVVRANILSVRPDIDPAEIGEDRSMTDLGCDSLDRMDVVVGSLDAMGLELNSETFAGVHDIGGLVDVLLANANANEP